MKKVLLILLGFVAFTAIPSGVLLMVQNKGAFGLSVDLLKTTPFDTFLIPGLILCLVVGSGNLLAFYYNLRNRDSSFWWSLAAGILTGGWIAVQIALIREFFWLQWLYLLTGIFILLITLQLKHRELI